MYCANCGAELQHEANFCPKCGRTTGGSPVARDSGAAAAPAIAPERQSSRSILWAVLVLGLLFLLGALVIVNRPSNEQRRQTTIPATVVVPQPVVVPIMTKPLTLQPGQYSYFQFEVPSDAKNVELRGRFEASGGSGNDIEVFVLDSDAFVNWQNKHAVKTWFNSGKVTQKSFQVPLPPEPARYYLVFSNTYSLVSNKAVAGEVKLQYVR